MLLVVVLAGAGAVVIFVSGIGWVIEWRHEAYRGVSVRVEVDLNSIWVMQTDQHGAAVVSGDDAAVLLAEFGAVVNPGMHSQVPLTADADVADRDLHVMDWCKAGIAPSFD